jgi:hypothetical protein
MHTSLENIFDFPNNSEVLKIDKTNGNYLGNI